MVINHLVVECEKTNVTVLVARNMELALASLGRGNAVARLPHCGLPLSSEIGLAPSVLERSHPTIGVCVTFRWQP